jgi:hypothetical protein
MARLLSPFALRGARATTYYGILADRIYWVVFGSGPRSARRSSCAHFPSRGGSFPPCRQHGASRPAAVLRRSGRLDQAALPRARRQAISPSMPRFSAPGGRDHVELRRADREEGTNHG